MVLGTRRTQSFTYRREDRQDLPRPAVVRLVPGKVVRVYSSPPSIDDWRGTTPLSTSFRAYPAHPPLYRKRPLSTVDSTDSMTRLFFTPSRGGDVRSRASINRSSSTSNISSSCDYYNSNMNISRLSVNDDPKGISDLHDPQRHRYLQHYPQIYSSSASNILPVIPETPGREGASISRSQSFAGMTQSHNTRLVGRSPPVLGDTMRRTTRTSPKVSLGLHSFRKSSRGRKVPCPNRTMMIVECAKRGIGEFIQRTYEDIALLISGDNGASMGQKIKSAERYLTKLEFQLTKIDELKDCYLLHQQMREGARSMAHAFSVTTSHRRKDNIASIKYGYKECSQAMCAIEGELEHLMGTFSCRLKGIAGFARVVPKDVFEVVIKHGDQKWKTKGRIEKDSTQRWDTPDYTFKCLVGEMFRIKASEVRAFKSVLLGQKNCEICNPQTHGTSSNQGLFSACPQLMTVNINDHGSLKLSIIFTWNPLGNMDDSVTYFQSPIHPAVSANKIWPASSLSPNGSLTNSSLDLTGRHDSRFRGLFQNLKHQNNSGVYGSATSLPSHITYETAHRPHFRSESPVARACSWKTNFPSIHQRPYSFSTFDVRNPDYHTSQPSSPTSGFSDTSFPHSISTSLHSEGVSSLRCSSLDLASTSSPALASSSSPALVSSLSPLIPLEVTQDMVPGLVIQQMEPYDCSLTVREALESLMTTLEDFLGHYSELQTLEEVVQVVDALVRKTSVTRSRASSINGSIDGAIEEAFDFLNTEEGHDDFDEDNESETEHGHKMSPQITNIDKILVSPSSTANTADSGIESLAKCLQEDLRLGSSTGSSPVPSSSGNEQVDQALIFHLTYCDKLLRTMGNFGPLKCRELYALDYLQKQAVILEKLVGIAQSGSDVDLHAVLSVETSDKAMRELWVFCVDQTPLYVRPEKIISVLEQKYGTKLAEKYEIRPIRIFYQIMAQMLNFATYNPEVGHTSIVTLHQCMLFFRHTTGLRKAEEVAEELHLMDRLNATSSDAVSKTILSLREELPPPVCLKMLVKLLVGNTRKIQKSVTTYLKAVSKNKMHRDKVLVVLVEGLEDNITDVRAGCCVALSILEADECLDQLVHVSQSDSSPEVCRQAKEALYSFGDVGRQAMEEAQLSSNGFQGLHMHKLSVQRRL